MIRSRPKNSPIWPLIQQWRADYRELGEQVIPYIELLLSQGKTPETAVKRAFRRFRVSDAIQEAILAQMIAASAIGYGVKVVAKPKALKSFYLSKVWPGEKFSLSEKIARKNMQGIIAQHIRSEMSKSVDVVRMANRLADTSITDWRPSGRIRADLPKHLKELQAKARRMAPDDKRLQSAIRKSRREIERLAAGGAPNKRLKAAYSELVDKIQTGSAKAQAKALEIAVMEKGRYNAERIARTETARAYGLSHDYKASMDTDVIGVKIDLSTRHPAPDICDFHAKADLYGMGPGVYPKDKQPPYPFHPHCTCVKSHVYVGETKVGNFNPKKAEEFIDNTPAGMSQKDLLGVAGAEAYKSRTRWQAVLKNWNGHEKPDFSGVSKNVLI